MKNHEENKEDDIRVPPDTQFYVAKKCCHECFFFSSEKGFSQEQSRQMVEEALEDKRSIECLVITVARRCGYSVPEYCYCFAYFYQYWERIPEFVEAMRDGRLHFLDVSGLPGLRESGLHLVGDKPWY